MQRSPFGTQNGEQAVSHLLLNELRESASAVRGFLRSKPALVDSLAP